MCDPIDSDDVLSVATPDDTVPVPSDVAPSLKLTVPVAAVKLTVAVNVTLFPNCDGLGDDVNVVVVVAGLTTCDTVFEVLPLNVASPE